MRTICAIELAGGTTARTASSNVASDTHRRTHIEHEVADEVCLHLVLLDEILVAVVIDPPIDVPRIIAGDILAVPRELHREAGQRRFMVPCQRAHHEPTRFERPTGETAEDLRIEIPRENALCHGCRSCQAAGRS
jgi:hypothetical protein